MQTLNFQLINSLGRKKNCSFLKTYNVILLLQTYPTAKAEAASQVAPDLEPLFIYCNSISFYSII